MRIFRDTTSFPISSLLLTEDMLKQSVFFDIETTGLHWKSSHLCIIGMVYHDNGQWKMTQIFLESPLDEQEALAYFMDILRDRHTLIHFNGSSFDIPYLTRKCALYNVGHPFDTMNSIDLYHRLSYLKKLFPLTSFRQKDLEYLADFKRSDQLSGKDIITVYQDYLKSADDCELDLLLLHNREDLLGMTAFASVFKSSALYSVPLLRNHHTGDRKNRILCGE